MSKSSLFKRSRSLLGMATKVAAKEAGLKISSALKSSAGQEIAKKLTRIQQAHTITKNLSQLKGAAMKAGQLLSIDASQILPPEATEALAQLQNMAEPESFDVIDQVLKKELGEKLHSLKNLEESPLAAASIGQVHLAEFQDQKIAIKVQYPNIEESIDSDLEILRKLTQLFLKTTSKNIDLKDTFEELARVLKLEANYNHEAEVLGLVHNKLIGHPFFYAPKPFTEISTRKVLAMEYCPGLTLQEWLNTDPSQADKQKVGEEILKLFITEFLDWKIVQTDPNFGNFLVQKDPLKIVLLDFGSSLKYEKDFIKEYLNMLHITSTGNQTEVFEQAVSFGLLSPKEDKSVEEVFFEMMQISMEPFLSSDQPFDFSDDDYEKRTRDITIKFTKLLKHSPPPKKVIFLHRKLGGLFALLKKMEVQIDISLFWQNLMSQRDKF